MYKNYFPDYTERYAALPVISKDNVSQTRVFLNYPGYGGGYAWQGGGMRVGYSTGRHGEYKGKPVLQIFLENSEYPYGWVYAEEFRVGSRGKTATVSEVQNLVNSIISNNKKIVFENLVSARLIQVIELRGKRVPEEIKNTVRALQTRLNERDARLVANKCIEKHTKASPNVDARYVSALNALMGAKLGVVLTISVTTIAIVSLLIGAGVVTAFFLVLRNSSAQSAADYKISKNTQSVLKKLSPEDAATIEKEIRKAFGDGYELGSKSMLKNVGLFAAGIGIFFLAKPIANRLGLKF